jgi:outer membrane lipoprotein SlyB
MSFRRSISMKCLLISTMMSIGLAMSGCNSAQVGAGAGAGVGALAGQAIGHNTSSTLIGAGAGAVAGYVVGNEIDKNKAQQDRERMQREIDNDRYRSSDDN